MSNKENKENIKNSDTGIGKIMEKHFKTYFSAHTKDSMPSNLYNNVIDEIEKSLIIETLAATRGNQIKAAHILGINRNTLRAKIMRIKGAQKRVRKKDN